MKRKDAVARDGYRRIIPCASLGTTLSPSSLAWIARIQARL